MELPSAAQQRASMGSTTGCMRSAKMRMPSTSGSSVTMRMSTTSRRMMAKLMICPRCCVCAPSAIVLVVSMRAMAPGAPGRLAVVARSGAPRRRACGGRQGPRGQRRARQEPAAAQAHEQRVKCADCLDQLLRRHAVPWPASTSGWSNGGITLRPYCGAMARVLCSRSSM